MATPLLSINDLSVSFHVGDQVVNAIRDISFNVHAGEIVALVGESGSGKSVTSLSMLQLLPSPPARVDQGTILFNEDGNRPVDLLRCSIAERQKIRGNKISMIFQEPMTSLNPVFTCGYQVGEAILAHHKLTKQEAKKRTIAWFEKVKLPNPADLYSRYPHQLSGGQKQRVMIAMAMCCKPSLLICDEPTTALDVTVQKNVLELIKTLQRETGMGVIFITHDLGVVKQIADRAIVMFKGKIVEQGPVNDIFHKAQHPYTKALIACRPVNHKRGQRLPVVRDFLNSEPELQPQLATPKAIQQQKPASEATRKTLVSVEHLSVWFTNKKNWLGRPISYVKAVNDISFEVYENETLGIVGESGCGKSTLGRTLLQLIPATSGTIKYKEQNLNRYNPAQLRELRRHLQIVFQDPYSSLNPRQKIGAAIEEPLKVHGLFKTAAQRKQRTQELLQKVGLMPEHYDRYPHEFSGGQRQRIVIARALALQPSFIICDESVSALDVSVQAQVLNLLNDLKKEFGFTIVFISHDLSVVRYFSDRILVMNRGEIEEIGPADDIYESPEKEYTKRLIDAIPQ
ncbi:ABC transporter ATP-binding protein [Niabella insulamsoli]|uniref:ABC transporter ATP-binding protein n=1 Tax=Niabella insulamsoli TaxID=3144874 RepID=UPI0031FBFBAF